MKLTLTLYSGRGGGGREREVLSKKLAGAVQPASQNPDPIYDQSQHFSPTLFMTKICDFSYPNYDLFMTDQKFDTLFMTWYLLVIKMAAKWLKSITLFMTKTAEKPNPFGPHVPIEPI